MRIYKTTQKIEVKIDKISIFISPLTYNQKMELQGLMMKASTDMGQAMELVKKAMSMAIKDINGVVIEDENGKDTDYKLDFNGTELSDDCINDLLNMPISNKISSVCSSLLAGIPDRILDQNGEPIEGITIIHKNLGNGKKK